VRPKTTCLVRRLHVQVTAAKRGEDNFRIADLNEAARAADASREANGAVYGERLK
jgi:hypothetical protein